MMHETKPKEIKDRKALTFKIGSNMAIKRDYDRMRLVKAPSLPEHGELPLQSFSAFVVDPSKWRLSTSKDCSLEECLYGMWATVR